jgi:hypothetical protein
MSKKKVIRFPMLAIRLPCVSFWLSTDLFENMKCSGKVQIKVHTIEIILLIRVIGPIGAFTQLSA